MPNSRPRSSCRYCKATKNQNHPSNGWFWFPYQREIYGFRSAADSHTEGSHRENPCGRKNSNGIPKWHGLRTWWLWICRINSNLTSRRFGEEFQYLLSKISCKKVVPSALHELLRSQSLSANPFDWEVSYKTRSSSLINPSDCNSFIACLIALDFCFSLSSTGISTILLRIKLL